MKRVWSPWGLPLLILFGGSIALFTGLVLGRRPAKPSVHVSLLGFTNDGSGMSLAIFTISNASPWAVSRDAHYRVQGAMGARWTNLSEGLIAAGAKALATRQCESVTIPAPTNQQAWRLAVLTSREDGVLMGMVTELLMEGQKLGLPTRFRRPGQFWAVSEWIEGQ